MRFCVHFLAFAANFFKAIVKTPRFVVAAR
jgi:hypothetical protein